MFLPEDVERIREDKSFPHVFSLGGRVGVGCQYTDSFSRARYLSSHSFLFDKKHNDRVLVLNLANPYHTGGGVRSGAKAQEEDLCRSSSLLRSLESQEAKLYYEHNRSLQSDMGSDAMMISPNVDIIRDEKGNLLDKPVAVSVLTCAAPILPEALQEVTQEEYKARLFQRIDGMLKVAAHEKYQVLVLGAFGCGAFGNDACLVSDLFYKALKEFNYDGMRAESFFRRIDFAVLSRSSTHYNYNEFRRNFENFYRDEDAEERLRAYKKIKETEKYLDAIRGSMFGGAIGDALGYPIEFLGEKEIFGRYGDSGITSFELDGRTGKALISDDTQMSLFTANGIPLLGKHVLPCGESAAIRQDMWRWPIWTG